MSCFHESWFVFSDVRLPRVHSHLRVCVCFLHFLCFRFVSHSVQPPSFLSSSSSSSSSDLRPSLSPPLHLWPSYHSRYPRPPLLFLLPPFLPLLPPSVISLMRCQQGALATGCKSRCYSNVLFCGCRGVLLGGSGGGVTGCCYSDWCRSHNQILNSPDDELLLLVPLHPIFNFPLFIYSHVTTFFNKIYVFI